VAMQSPISSLNLSAHVEAEPASLCDDDVMPRRTPPVSAILLTSGEAATYLGYSSYRTMENFRYRKVGPPYIYLPTGAVRYRQADLDAWVGSASHPEQRELSYEAFVKRQQAEKRKARDRERKAQQAAARKAQWVAEERS
jgi:hypothetical protein